ncbi:MAG: hypothetical protein CL947_03735 [Epsilonproteobacteria bacterium]|nr:hypothetical protein [Campylobacterota bacterium]|tara:strand:- start:5269 stop:5658 length:390 start_codon:yes stop_codon:yes gene_type:complete
MYKLLALHLFLLCFTGCCMQTLSVKKTKQNNVHELLARMSDIPDMPFSVKVTDCSKSESNPNSVQIQGIYRQSSQSDIVDYYIEGMERCGWDLKSSYIGDEAILLFSRPSGTYCSISVRRKRQLCITIL